MTYPREKNSTLPEPAGFGSTAGAAASFVQPAEENLPGSPGDRPKFDSSSACAAETASGKGDSFIAQEAFGEFRILRADVGQSIDDLCPAEQLCLEPLAPGAALQKSVDEEFHEMDAIPLRLARTVTILVAGQQEMVHPADIRNRVAHAGRHT